jgi:hypothetical protein
MNGLQTLLIVIIYWLKIKIMIGTRAIA